MTDRATDTPRTEKHVMVRVGQMSGLSTESPCIWCAGPLTLCGIDSRCCELCDHPYQIDWLIKRAEAAAGPRDERLDVERLAHALCGSGWVIDERYDYGDFAGLTTARKLAEQVAVRYALAKTED